MADDDLLQELNEVRAANARLRGLLGLDGRRAESHPQSWEPAPFQDAPRLPRVDGRSSADEKLGLYQQLFAGHARTLPARDRRFTRLVHGSTMHEQHAMRRVGPGRLA